MENCLITKLNAVVDNPNLPILEVMQQFTLDAITESGNSVMTDDQKWALNHFFYQIGAIDNSGIYAKLECLYMPLICNQNLNKALVDYTGKHNIGAANNCVFNGNGIKSYDGVTHIAGKIANSNILPSINDFSLIILCEASTDISTCIYFNTNSPIGYPLKFNSTQTVGSYMGIKRFVAQQFVDYIGIINTRSAADSYRSTMILENGVIDSGWAITNNGSEWPETITALNVVAKGNTDTSSTKILGLTNTALTPVEEGILSNALRDLRLAFPDTEI